MPETPTASKTPGLEMQPFHWLHRFDDYDAFAETARGWDVQFDQLDSGRFWGEWEQLVLGSTLVSRARMGRAILQRGASPDGRITFGIPADSSQHFTWRRHEIDSRSLLVFPMGRDYESIGDGTFHVFPVSFSLDHLSRVSQQLGLPEAYELATADSDVVVRDHSMHRLRRQLLKLFRETRLPGRLQSSKVRETVEFDLPRRILSLLADRRHVKRPRMRRRDLAIARAVDYIDAADGQPIAVRELAAEARVSWRTLHYAFRERYGVSPQSFLKSVRLNGFRRDLIRSDPAETKVADVASCWGFWHIGKLAADYRSKFGELPSQTIGVGEVSPERPASSSL